MNKGLIINFEAVASYLANESDDIQGKFFSVFLKELQTRCGTAHLTEQQLMSINFKLTKEEKELINTIGYIGENR